MVNGMTRWVMIGMVWIVLSAPLMVGAQGDGPSTDALVDRLQTAASQVRMAETVVISIEGIESNTFAFDTSVYNGTYNAITTYSMTVHIQYDPATGDRRVQADALVNELIEQDGAVGSFTISAEFISVDNTLYVNAQALDVPPDQELPEPTGWLRIMDDLTTVDDFDDLAEQLYEGDNPLQVLPHQVFDPELSLFALAAQGFTITDNITLADDTLEGQAVETISFDIAGQTLLQFEEHRPTDLGPYTAQFYDNLAIEYQFSLTASDRMVGFFNSNTSIFTTDDISAFDFPATATGTIDLSYITLQSMVFNYDIAIDPIAAPDTIVN